MQYLYLYCVAAVSFLDAGEVMTVSVVECAKDSDFRRRNFGSAIAARDRALTAERTNVGQCFKMPRGPIVGAIVKERSKQCVMQYRSGRDEKVRAVERVEEQLETKTTWQKLSSRNHTVS